VPAIIDYPIVLARMTAAGLRCNYHNSGAFGFAKGVTPFIRGWIGPGDATIKPALMDHVRTVPAPYESNLAEAAARVWATVLSGPVWVMPMSHWHFELHDGSRDWMPGLLEEIGVDRKPLEERADGTALEFSLAESRSFVRLASALLSNLRVSDFALAFPDKPVLAMLHHHKQIWWSSGEAGLIAAIDKQLAAWLTPPPP